MARLKDNFKQTFKNIKVDELNKPVIFVVDMINGFVKEGALADPYIETISTNIIDLFTRVECRQIFIHDAHPHNTREFQAFPTHCLIGSEESEVVDCLKPYVHELIAKNSTNTFLASDFQLFLQERFDQYQDIIIVGCCSDICIMQFALSLNAYCNEHNMVDKRVIVVESCIDTYDSEVHQAIEYNEMSIKLMQQSGIMVVSEITKG